MLEKLTLPDQGPHRRPGPVDVDSSMLASWDRSRLPSLTKEQLMSGEHFQMKLVFSDCLFPAWLLISMSHNFPGVRPVVGITWKSQHLNLRHLCICSFSIMNELFPAVAGRVTDSMYQVKDLR